MAVIMIVVVIGYSMIDVESQLVCMDREGPFTRSYFCSSIVCFGPSDIPFTSHYFSLAFHHPFSSSFLSSSLSLFEAFLPLLFFSTPVVIPFTAPFQPAHILGHLFCLLTCSIGTRLLPSSLVRANTLLRFWTLLPPPNLVRELIIDNGKHTDIAICDVSKLAGCLRVVCVHHWRGGRCGVRLPVG